MSDVASSGITTIAHRQKLMHFRFSLTTLRNCLSRRKKPLLKKVQGTLGEPFKGFDDDNLLLTSVEEADVRLLVLHACSCVDPGV